MDRLTDPLIREAAALVAGAATLGAAMLVVAALSASAMAREVADWQAERQTEEAPLRAPGT